MAQADIGLIGLGVMGSNLALNIAEKGHRIAVFNRTTARTDALRRACRRARGTDRALPDASPNSPQAIRPPRPIILMVQAGQAVDEQIAALRPLLAGRRHHHRRRQRQFPRHHAALRRARRHRASPSSAWASPAARRARATARRSWSGGTRGLLDARRADPDRDRRQVQGRAVLRPGSAKTAPAISSRPSTTASNMPTCR